MRTVIDEIVAQLEGLTSAAKKQTDVLERLATRVGDIENQVNLLSAIAHPTVERRMAAAPRADHAALRRALGKLDTMLPAPAAPQPTGE